MKAFDPKLYYKTKKIRAINHINQVIIPTESGLALILQYLEVKYRCNIHRPRTSLCDWLDKPQDLVTLQIPSVFDSLFLKIRSTKDDVRHAYILDSSGHAIFLAYVKEKNEEYLLLSDSSGSSREIAETIANKNQIKIFITEDARQADGASTCLLDALVFSRDITRINPDNSYYIPNLTFLLKQREQKITDNVSAVLLPNQLLKTSQRTTFFSTHLDVTKSAQYIHKKETINSFRSRYSQMCIRYPGDKNKAYAIYLYEKSIKYQLIMEIQFYLNELEKMLHYKLPNERRLRFIASEKIRILSSLPFSYDTWILKEQNEAIQTTLESQNCCVIS